MSALNQPRILVVEDDSDIQQILSVYLKHSGFEVLVASGGQEAMSVIPEFCPHLIVLDLMMRPVSGWEVLYWLHANRQARCGDGTLLHTIPVVLLTALSEIKKQLDGFEAGAVEYITKPAQPARLVEAISRLLKLSTEQLALLRLQRLEAQRKALARINAPQPDEISY